MIYRPILLCLITLLLLVPDPLVTSPDLGWHIRAGAEMIARGAIPHDAWFTFTVPEFPLISHECLHDILVAVLWQLGAYLTITALPTLLNPYGVAVYEEIIRTITDAFPRTAVVEWLAPTLESNSGAAFYLIAGMAVSLIFERREIPKYSDLLPLIVFFALDTTATRHVSFFIILGITYLLTFALHGPINGATKLQEVNGSRRWQASAWRLSVCSPRRRSRPPELHAPAITFR